MILLAGEWLHCAICGSLQTPKAFYGQHCKSKTRLTKLDTKCGITNAAFTMENIENERCSRIKGNLLCKFRPQMIKNDSQRSLALPAPTDTKLGAHGANQNVNVTKGLQDGGLKSKLRPAPCRSESQRSLEPKLHPQPLRSHSQRSLRSPKIVDIEPATMEGRSDPGLKSPVLQTQLKIHQMVS